MAKTLMIQGTTSDAGKSLVVAGLCRVMARRGVKVAPFKPQNMALNSAVTEDGGEIGRAQAVQARACGLKPHSDMNPVLLKPNSDTGAQVIIQGKARLTLEAGSYQDYKPLAMAAVLESYRRLSTQYDLILVEGAGSPAEINLRANDIANMGFAEAVDCPVILVADIDRGGVFAHFVGTLALLSPSEQQRVQGFLINKFRGDIDLLLPGNRWLEQRTGKPVLGTIPYLQGLYLEAEDALPRDQAPALAPDHQRLRVVIPALPRISNHTDFDALRLHPQVDVHFVGPDQAPPPADLVILPGSKSVRPDLQWLIQQGWLPYLQRHLRYGGKLLGICGGYQMLGTTIDDPLGVESTAGSSRGLGFLPVRTQLEPEKHLSNRQGKLFDGSPIRGYEIHCGSTILDEALAGFAEIDGQPEGAISNDGQVAGTYLHGLFDHPAACRALLTWAGLCAAQPLDLQQQIEQNLERLADCFEQHLNWQQLDRWL